jgi:hypothetical protein
MKIQRAPTKTKTLLIELSITPIIMPLWVSHLTSLTSRKDGGHNNKMISSNNWLMSSERKIGKELPAIFMIVLMCNACIGGRKY